MNRILQFHCTKRDLIKLLPFQITLFFLLVTGTLLAQEGSRLDTALDVPSKWLTGLQQKADKAQRNLEKATDRYLTRLQRREEKLKRKLWKKDSAEASRVFGDVAARYEGLKSTSGGVHPNQSFYSGRLDSITTSLSFIQRTGNADPSLTSTLNQYKTLQERFNASSQIRRQLQERQRLLKAELEKLGMVRALRGLQKDVYYYSAQVQQLKSDLDHPDRLAQQLIQLAMKQPSFRAFFRKYSLLGTLFALPGESPDPASLAGLQTRSSINNLLQTQFGQGSGVTSALQQKMGAAQSQLASLRSRAQGLQTGSWQNGDAEAPSFKPNTQKTRSFLDRLELGFNVQSQRARYFFPVTSDLALSLGYKLNDRSILGIGASYKVGWGRSWEALSITHQGIGLRSYLDWKIKGQIYATGGYELNYRQLIKEVDQLKDFSAWQSSGLIGLSKRYKLGKVNGEMKLMWDFLSHRQVPRTQTFVYRIGYRIK